MCSRAMFRVFDWDLTPATRHQREPSCAYSLVVQCEFSMRVLVENSNFPRALFGELGVCVASAASSTV